MELILPELIFRNRVHELSENDIKEKCDINKIQILVNYC